MASKVLSILTVAGMLLVGCASHGGSARGGAAVEPSCSAVFSRIIDRERSGDTDGAINAELDWLSRNCSAESGVWADYASASVYAKRFGTEACSSWEQHIGREAIDLLAADGLCVEDAAAPPGEDTVGGQPLEAVSWSDAADYVGTSQRVCGPLENVGTSDDDVFLNIGRPYPDPQRFTIVLWDVGGVEELPSGTTLCTTGNIVLYEGVAQIQLNAAELVEVHR